MKKLLLLFSLVSFISLGAFAQTERYEIIIHKTDGSKEEVAAELNFNKPWQHQKSISVFDRSLMGEKKIKNKQKTKYKAKDLDGFEVEGKRYITKKVIVNSGDYGSTMKGLPAYTFVERIVDGTITVYQAYSYPPGVASGITFEEIYESIRSQPQYLLMKGNDGKVKDISVINIEKWIDDAPETSKKFDDGEFGNFKRKSGKKVANFMKGQMENENPSLILDVVRAYNAEKG